MFGSLVIVFPTPHKGGALLLRRHGYEWIFDSSQVVAAEGQLSIAYVAFSSDIEHEVALVTSGHRIALTYNLYFDDGGPVSANDAVSEHLILPQLANKGAFRESFMALLDNPEFLAEGGTLAFGLRHAYPINDGQLERIYSLLKGSDAVVYQVIRALGYEPVLYFWYKESRNCQGVIIDDVLSMEDSTDGEYGIEDIALNRGGILVTQGEIEEEFVNDEDGPPEWLEWVTPLLELNRQDCYYGGSQCRPGVYLAHGYLCLIVRIGMAGDRMAYPTVAELKEAWKRTSRYGYLM